jgi:hypothetical protein
MESSAPWIEPACEPPNPGAAIAIRLALAVLAGKQAIEEVDDPLIVTLKALYDEDPFCRVPVDSTGKALPGALDHRPGEYLAAAYIQHQQERWERDSAQRWSCPCGVTFALFIRSFYTLTADGLFAGEVSLCPGCGRDLANVRATVVYGQLGFAF